MSAPPVDIDIGELTQELLGATMALERAEQESAMARNNETSALNRVNAAQKAVDRWYDGQRKTAARSSDWSRNK